MIIKRFIIALSLLLVFMIHAFASSYVDNFTKDEQIKTALELLQTYNAQEIFDNLEENVHLIYEDTDFTLSAISYLFFHDELDILASTLTNFLCIEKGVNV